MQTANRWTRPVLAILGGCSLVYCAIALVYVATAPDVRLRCLLVEAPIQPGKPTSVIIRKTPGIEFKGPRPMPGDELLRIGEQRLGTSLDFFRYMDWLRTAPTPPGGRMLPGGDPLEQQLPKLVQEEGGPRWVEIEFFRPQDNKTYVASIAVQGVPFGEIGLTLVWFLLQLAIFSVGAVAFWRRPFDHPAQLFFAMCLVTISAFVGGFHWWVIAGNPWVNLPFAMTAIMVPVVTFHFFLIYPRPKHPFDRYPFETLVSIYAIPVAALVLFLLAEWSIWWLMATSGLSVEARALQMVGWLAALKSGVYIYVSIAALYFAGIIAALVHGVWTTRNPVERNQVKWILWAGIIATLLIGYTLLLAGFSRADFALGGGRWPMFFASLVFMLAYAVGIGRFKLMLVDQVVSRGMLYYVLSFGTTLTVSIAISMTAVAAVSWREQLTSPQLTVVAAILVVIVGMFLWARDAWQRLVDRRFFREKYQLDKALQRMNRAVGQLADTESLAQRMAGSCRDVIQAERAAIYLREGRSSNFRLIAAEGVWPNVSLQIATSADFVMTLTTASTLQAVPAASRDSLNPVQSFLRDLQAELIHALEVEGELSGFVVLGPRQTNGVYSAEDITFLTAMGQITGVALHCAKVHKDLSRLNEELRLKVDRIEQQKQQILMLQAEVNESQEPFQALAETDFNRGTIRGSSQALMEVLEIVRKAAASESSVLITGESGTGKELMAQAIHANSPRRDGPLVIVHCAALSTGLLESELFGHVKGAFTGAHSDKPGRFEMANGGTLFLDEIGEIPLETQVKLLRVLQQRTFERVGSGETLRCDVRLVTATHKNLEQAIRDGRFREDLYYRLNVVNVALPPLRDRKDDLYELIRHFLKQAAGKTGKNVTQVDEAALSALLAYPWPGNIRELENVIERAVVLSESYTLTLLDLPQPFRRLETTAHRRSETNGSPVNGLPVSLDNSAPAAESTAFRLAGDGRQLIAPHSQEAGSKPSPTRPRPDNRLARRPRSSAATSTQPATAALPPGVSWVASNPSLVTPLGGYDGTDDQQERQMLIDALQQCRGNKAEAARMLGLPRSTYFSKLKKHRIAK
ncbi:MAG: sigma-54-dependent Fis family transcriptional regulator [Planctomyces sp.]|nr:sigma-54-dependent Fis family transcriptional regulator [Planctomyces sp.]